MIDPLVISRFVRGGDFESLDNYVEHVIDEWCSDDGPFGEVAEKRKDGVRRHLLVYFPEPDWHGLMRRQFAHTIGGFEAYRLSVWTHVCSSKPFLSLDDKIKTSVIIIRAQLHAFANKVNDAFVNQINLELSYYGETTPVMNDLMGRSPQSLKDKMLGAAMSLVREIESYLSMDRMKKWVDFHGKLLDVLGDKSFDEAMKEFEIKEEPYGREHPD